MIRIFFYLIKKVQDINICDLMYFFNLNNKINFYYILVFFIFVINSILFYLLKECDFKIVWFKFDWF